MPVKKKAVTNKATTNKATTNKRNGLTKADKQMVVNALTRSLIPGQYTGYSLTNVAEYGLDYYGIPRYPSEIGVADYKWMYRFNGLAKRIVNIYPSGCWQEFPTIREGLVADKSEFEKVWNTLSTDPKLKLPFNLLKADKLSGIGRFGILFLGLDDNKKADTPVGKAKNLLYLRAFDESSVTISETDNDTSSARYGQPTFYQINLQEVGTATTTFPTKVHWSRILHIVEDTSESEIYGEPRLQSITPQVIDIALLLHGSTHMYIRGGFPGISFEADADTELTAEDATAMRTQIEDYFQSMTRYLTTQGVKANSLSIQVASPEPYIKAQMEFISATTGIPSRMLAGSEQAQLASQQDRANFNDRIHARQDNYVTPGIVLPFIEKLQGIGILPPTSEPITCEWKQTDLSSRLEKAKISQMRADALAKYAAQPMAPSIMSEEKFLGVILDCTPEQIKDIMASQTKLKPEDMLPEEDDVDISPEENKGTVA